MNSSLLFRVLTTLAFTACVDLSTIAQTDVIRTGRFTRGTGTNTSYQSFVVPLDLQKGLACTDKSGFGEQLYWSQEYNDTFEGAPSTRQRTQAPPGTKSITDQKISSETGQLYPRETIYDEYGRKVGNNDFTDHGRANVHTTPHHHVNPPSNPYEHSRPIPGPHPQTPIH